MDRCSACGDEKPLDPTGVCAWRAGCEHRQMQARARDAEFDADYRFHFDPLPCGHTRAEHQAQWDAMRDAAPWLPPHPGTL